MTTADVPEDGSDLSPEPAPERTGSDAIDSDNLRDWKRSRRQWVADHGDAQPEI